MAEEKLAKEKGGNALAVNFMDDAGAGLENVTQDDLVIPRLKLVQALSPQAQKHDGAFIEGISVGDIFTTKNERYQDVLPNGNTIQTTANHYVLQVQKDGSFTPVMLAMTGTQLKKSKRWNSMMASIKIKSSDGQMFTPATYSHKYKLTAVPESNDSGSWYGWNVTNLGMLTEGETDLYSSAKEFGSTVNAISYTSQDEVA